MRCAGSPPRKKNQWFRSPRPFRFDFFFTARNEDDADVCGEHGSQQFLLPRIFDDALDSPVPSGSALRAKFATLAISFHSIPRKVASAMRQATFSLVGDAQRSKVTLKPMANLPSSSVASSASR
jgi:hypothetical protein